MSSLQDLYDGTKDAIDGLAEASPNTDTSANNDLEVTAGTDTPNEESSWHDKLDSYPKSTQRAIFQVLATSVMLALIWLVSQWWSAMLFAAIGFGCMICLPLFFYIRTTFFQRKSNAMSKNSPQGGV